MFQPDTETRRLLAHERQEELGREWAPLPCADHDVSPDVPATAARLRVPAALIVRLQSLRYLRAIR